MQLPTEHPTPLDHPAGGPAGRFGKHPLRAGTIVWGAVIMAAGILIILSTALDIALDPGLTVMWLLLGAGVVMVAAGAVNLLGRGRR